MEYTNAVSFLVKCKDQAEVDKYWKALAADGGEEMECSWLTDKYGVRWQIAPTVLLEHVTDEDPERAKRAMQAMMKMKKIDVAAIEKAVG